MIKKDVGAVTTLTEGILHPLHSTRKKQLKEMLDKMMNTLSKHKPYLETIQKADPEGLTDFIEQSIYSRNFAGMEKSISEQIKDFILRGIAKKYSKGRVVKYIKRKSGADDYQADNIYRTENNALRNKVREWAYKQIDPEGVQLYKWIGPNDSRTTNICKAISQRTRDGVNMKELNEVITDEVQKAKERKELPENFEMRDWCPHFSCRHTMIRHYSE